MNVRVVEQHRRSEGGTDWSRSMRILGSPAVTNDGSCIIDFATEGNLIAMEETEDAIAFVVYCRDSKDKVFRVGQFIDNFQGLPLSVSHRVWAATLGLDENGHLTLRTAERRNFVIDPPSGRLLEGAFAH